MVGRCAKYNYITLTPHFRRQSPASFAFLYLLEEAPDQIMIQYLRIIPAQSSIGVVVSQAGSQGGHGNACLNTQSHYVS